MNIKPDPIAQVQQWHAKSQPGVVPDNVKYDDQVDRFNHDFAAMSRLDGSRPYSAGLFFSPGDSDPRPGSVNVAGVGSLQKTSDGFSLQVTRMGFHGSVAGWSSYQINEKNQTIQVEHTTLPYAAGMFYQAGQTERFTLHTDNQSVSDYQKEPPAYLAGSTVTKNTFS